MRYVIINIPISVYSCICLTIFNYFCIAFVNFILKAYLYHSFYANFCITKIFV